MLHPTSGEPLSSVEEARRRLLAAKDRDDFVRAQSAAWVAIAEALTRIADQYEDVSRYPNAFGRSR